MTDAPVEIRLTSEFQRKLKRLAKKYCQAPSDLQPVIEQLRSGEVLGDQIAGIGFSVLKVRVRNSDTQKGKSGSYRLIYWLSSTDLIVLLDVYSKSDQEDTEVEAIRQIIKGFSSTSEATDT